MCFLSPLMLSEIACLFAPLSQDHTFRAPKPYLSQGKTVPFGGQKGTYWRTPLPRRPDKYYK